MTCMRFMTDVAFLKAAIISIFMSTMHHMTMCLWYTVARSDKRTANCHPTVQFPSHLCSVSVCFSLLFWLHGPQMHCFGSPLSSVSFIITAGSYFQQKALINPLKATRGGIYRLKSRIFPSRVGGVQNGVQNIAPCLLGARLPCQRAYSLFLLPQVT